MLYVISLGGSIVAPSTPDVEFITKFGMAVKNYLSVNEEARLILTIGGGGLARSYITAYKNVTSQLLVEKNDYDADMIGIMATRLNAQLIKAVFASLCPSPVVYDPTAISNFEGRILLAAGWKPGFSTDTDAVILAERFEAKMLINLSNIAKVYTADPKVDKNAQPIDNISWDDFIANIVGNEWSPGKNLPFDPIASQKAKKAGIRVICADGKDIKNLENILNGSTFVGTTIG